MIYYNRIRYKGTTPVIASSLSSNPKVMYDGIDCVSIDNVEPTPPAPSYTLVSCLKSNGSSTEAADLYFDTLISPSQEDMVLTMDFQRIDGDGIVWFGNVGCPITSDEYEDENDFRFFGTSQTDCYLDVGDGRMEEYISENLTHFILTYQYNNKTVYLSNGSDIEFSFSFSEYPNDNHIYIPIHTMRFTALQISKNGTDVFNGHAALDSDNKPCIYDSVTGTFFYALGTKASYDLTYEA